MLLWGYIFVCESMMSLLKTQPTLSICSKRDMSDLPLKYRCSTRVLAVFSSWCEGTPLRWPLRTQKGSEDKILSGHWKFNPFTWDMRSLVIFLHSHIQGNIPGRVGFRGRLPALHLSTTVGSRWVFGWCHLEKFNWGQKSNQRSVTLSNENSYDHRGLHVSSPPVTGVMTSALRALLLHLEQAYDALSCTIWNCQHLTSLIYQRGNFICFNLTDIIAPVLKRRNWGSKSQD